MLRAMSKLPGISFVGAGALANGLAKRLRESGYRIDEIIVRDGRESLAKGRRLATKVRAKAVRLEQATFKADLIWFAVPDDSLASCAESVAKAANWNGRIALHSSGALTSDELAPLRKLGASVASLHPMMTFVKNQAPDLKGVAFAMEGDRRATAVGKRIAVDLGGTVFTIQKKAKPLYHVFGALLSPLLVSQLTAAEEVAKAAGIPASAVATAMAPILLRTLENYFAEGGAKAFSGPLVRGDVQTIRRHVAALGQKPAAEVYKVLARYAVDQLPVKNGEELKRVLTATTKSRRREGKHIPQLPSTRS